VPEVQCRQVIAEVANYWRHLIQLQVTVMPIQEMVVDSRINTSNLSGDLVYQLYNMSIDCKVFEI